MGERARADDPGADLTQVAPFEDLPAAIRAVREIETENGDGVVLARLLRTIAAVEERAVELARRAEIAEAESVIDPLTGLHNRRAWIRLLGQEEARCRRHGIIASVIIVDLDNLKEVNDTAGHAAGDALLCRVARTILGHIRAHDAVVRLGGDEFGILAVHCPEPHARALAARILDSLERQGVGASAGVSERSGEGGLHTAWDRADADMYAAKRSNRRS